MGWWEADRPKLRHARPVLKRSNFAVHGQHQELLMKNMFLCGHLEQPVAFVNKQQASQY